MAYANAINTHFVLCIHNESPQSNAPLLHISAREALEAQSTLSLVEYRAIRAIRSANETASKPGVAKVGGHIEVQ